MTLIYQGSITLSNHLGGIHLHIPNANGPLPIVQLIITQIQITNNSNPNSSLGFLDVLIINDMWRQLEVKAENKS